MEFSDYRFLCGVMHHNKKKRAEANRCGFLLNSSEVADFFFGEKGQCDKKFVYGSESKLFYRKKRAILRCFYELDQKMEVNMKKIEDPPLSYDSDGNIIIEDFMFEGHDEDAQLTLERDDTSNRVTLLSLLFTGFEHSLKCPFSKVYSDINHLIPCYLPDEQCKNGRFGTLETLLQHVQSKHCRFHDILGDYIRYFTDDNNDEYIRLLVNSRASVTK